MTAESFYRRPLPDLLVAFSSPEGRIIFQEALELGGMAGYFPLAEQFHTQAEPAFCGLGTLVIVLNALSIDPGRVWKGVWRWYGEEFLDCCQPLAVVKNNGITFDEFSCLAQCNGAISTPYRYHQSSLEEFRQAVHQVSMTPVGAHLVASYSRSVLGQTGDGHFSPIGGYHAKRDLVLLMDVARFKYPPHWVPLPLLWQAFSPIDPATGKDRGFILLQRSDLLQETVFRIGLNLQEWSDISPYFSNIIQALLLEARADSPITAIKIILKNLPDHSRILQTTDNNGIPLELKVAVRSNPLFKLIETALVDSGSDSQIPVHDLSIFLTVLLLSCPETIYQSLEYPLKACFEEARKLALKDEILKQEILKLQEQMIALQNLNQS